MTTPPLPLPQPLPLPAQRNHRCRHRDLHRTALLTTALLCLLLVGDMAPTSCGLMSVEAFAIVPADRHAPCRRSSSRLAMGITSSTSRIATSVPSQSQCEALGVREWPQQSKTGIWTETVAPENSLQRYVLEGTGSLAVVADDNSATTIPIKPGTLVEIRVGTPSVTLEWECAPNCPEVILLTPGFEEGGVFLGVIAGIVVLFGALLSSTG